MCTLHSSHGPSLNDPFLVHVCAPSKRNPIKKNRTQLFFFRGIAGAFDDNDADGIGWWTTLERDDIITKTLLRTIDFGPLLEREKES
jgi:hypothetical protein